jgi:urease accessory protein UreF
MFATVVSTLIAFMVTVGVVKDVAVPAGAYAYEKGTEAYVAGKELIIGTEAD